MAAAPWITQCDSPAVAAGKCQRCHCVAYCSTDCQRAIGEDVTNTTVSLPWLVDGAAPTKQWMRLQNAIKEAHIFRYYQVCSAGRCFGCNDKSANWPMSSRGCVAIAVTETVVSIALAALQAVQRCRAGSATSGAWWLQITGERRVAGHGWPKCHCTLAPCLAGTRGCATLWRRAHRAPPGDPARLCGAQKYCGAAATPDTGTGDAA